MKIKYQGHTYGTIGIRAYRHQAFEWSRLAKCAGVCSSAGSGL